VSMGGAMVPTAALAGWAMLSAPRSANAALIVWAATLLTSRDLLWPWPCRQPSLATRRFIGATVSNGRRRLPLKCCAVTQRVSTSSCDNMIGAPNGAGMYRCIAASLQALGAAVLHAARRSRIELGHVMPRPTRRPGLPCDVRAVTTVSRHGHAQMRVPPGADVQTCPSAHARGAIRGLWARRRPHPQVTIPPRGQDRVKTGACDAVQM
jgi:hypothetical protein